MLVIAPPLSPLFCSPVASLSSHLMAVPVILFSPPPSPSPLHQDGSCNGLQHYAALGRDVVGATSVNLMPCDVPQDVYSGVAQQVSTTGRFLFICILGGGGVSIVFVPFFSHGLIERNVAQL